MNKLLLALSLLLTSLLNCSNNNNATNYVLNMTGRTIILNFYTGNMGGSFLGNQFVNSVILGPMLFGGKSPNDVMAGLTATLLPQEIDMQLDSSSKITIDAFKINSKNTKDKSIKGCTIPTPSVTDIPQRDYLITLETVNIYNKGDQEILVTKRLNTSMGIPIKSAANIQQWPTVAQIQRMGMSPQEKIASLTLEDQTLQNAINKLHKEITKMHDRNNNIKSGMNTKVTNRRKMISIKHQQINNNKKSIAQLQKAIDQANGTATKSTTKKSSEKHAHADKTADTTAAVTTAPVSTTPDTTAPADDNTQAA